MKFTITERQLVRLMKDAMMLAGFALIYAPRDTRAYAAGGRVLKTLKVDAGHKERLEARRAVVRPR